MVVSVFLLMAAALGVAGFGQSAGDYVRRQVTADAASKSGASVLADRLRHIGRLQERGLQVQAMGDPETAQRYADAAWQIAAQAWPAVRNEAAGIAAANGASRWDVRSTTGQWFVPIEVSGPAGGESGEQVNIFWVGLAGDFERMRLYVSIEQSDAEGTDRHANALTAVRSESAVPGEPITVSDWMGHLAVLE